MIHDDQDDMIISSSTCEGEKYTNIHIHMFSESFPQNTLKASQKFSPMLTKKTKFLPNQIIILLI